MEEQTTQLRGIFSTLEKVSFGILLLMIFFVPLFFIPGGFIPVQFGTSLLFAFGVTFSFLLFIIIRLREGSVEIPKSKFNFFILFLVVPLMYTLSFLANGISRMVFLGYTFDVSTVGFIILSFVFIYLTSVIFKNKNRIYYSFLVLVFSSILFASFLILRIIFGPAFLSFGVFTTLNSTVIGSWNSTGIFFGMCAILSLITYEMVKVTRFMKTIVGLALLFSMFFLAVINFTAIWIILAVISLLFLGYKIFSPDFLSAQTGYTSSNLVDSWNERIKKVSAYSIIVFIISLAFIFWGNSLGNKIADSLHISNLDVRPSLSITYDIAKKTLEKKPFFGSGPNTFVLQWLSYKPMDINSTVFWNTDFSYGVGLLPTFIVTTGILGLLSWLLFFVLYLYFGFRAFFWKEGNILSKYFGIASFFISLYLWIMSFIYIPGVVIFILTLFFTGLFLAHLYNNELMERKSVIFSFNPKIGFILSLILVSLFVAGLFLANSLYKNFSSLWYFQKALYSANVKGSLDDSEILLKKAIATVPYDVYYRTQSEISVARINNLFSQDLSKINKDDAQKLFSNELSKAINSGLNSRNADPSNYLNWISLGRAYEIGASKEVQIAGAYDSAKFAYSEAQKINPQNPVINLLFARLEIAKGNIKKAKEYTFEAIKQKQNYLDAYFLLSQLEVADNNLKGAIDSVSMATIIDPSNPSIYFQLGLLKYNNKDYAGAVEAFNKSIQFAPDYANAKYFLGLSSFQVGDKISAIKEFQDLQKTNPDSPEVKSILSNLLAGKPPFADTKSEINSKPEKGKTLPVKESGQ